MASLAGRALSSFSSVSPTLALATPDENLKALAQRLCSLYLLCEVSADRIYHDEIWLEKPGAERITWKWLAGVNYSVPTLTDAGGRTTAYPEESAL